MVVNDSFEDIELSPYKWATHLHKMESLTREEDVFPITVELDLVSYCNHHCSWCVDPEHLPHSLNKTFVSTLLNELRDLGIEGIVFKGGGEGSLHRSYATILHETRTLGFEVGVVTNGSKLIKHAEPLVENASYVRVSIDGPTKETHQRIHGSDDLDNILRGIDHMVQLRGTQRHPIIGLSFAMDYTLSDQVNTAISLGERLGVNYILFRPPFFEEVGRKSTMSVEQKKEIMAAFEDGKMGYHGKMKIFIDYWISDTEAASFSSSGDSPRRGKCLKEGINGIEHSTGTCLASPLLAVVAADKHVYPCCNLRFLKEWSIGTLDYENGNTFERIWHGERRREILGRIHQIECIGRCTHPMSKYNEIIAYLKSSQHHRGFV